MASSSTAPAAHNAAMEVSTMAEAFDLTADRNTDRVALRTRDGDQELTWGQLRDRVDALAAGLRRLGVQKGDNVALLFSNRIEFHIADLAVVTLGATPFSMYLTASPEQIVHLVTDAEAKVALSEQALLPALVKARADLPALEHLICVEGAVEDGLTAWDDVEQAEEGFDGRALRAELQPEDNLTLIYTSGTTGPPKGVQLTHKNLVAGCRAVNSVVRFPDPARVISWLPNAHIAERAAHHYIPIMFGMTVTMCPDPRAIGEVLPLVRPNWFFAVPRIWEKIRARLETMLAGLPDEQREKAQGALQAAIQKVRLEQAGQPVPEELAAGVAKADQEMFAGIRTALGLDQLAAVNAGAAPTPKEVLEFFHAIGIPVGELWGMSETCGAGAVNPPDKVKIGTVGKAVEGCELKLGEDGEVLIRGDFVMKGYRNLPDKTAETFDDDGFLRTGDIGEIDDEGYLRIVDRKKELIINAAGKNMSPANIEATLKSSSPLIGQAAVIGDAKPYNTALIVLDADFAPAAAEKLGIEDRRLESLAKEEQILAEVQKGVDAANEKLARVEQIKKFHLVSGDWLPGGDELTPTMKLKRKPIAEKYDAEINALYA